MLVYSPVLLQQQVQNLFKHKNVLDWEGVTDSDPFPQYYVIHVFHCESCFFSYAMEFILEVFLEVYKAPLLTATRFPLLPFS